MRACMQTRSSPPDRTRMNHRREDPRSGAYIVAPAWTRAAAISVDRLPELANRLDGAHATCGRQAVEQRSPVTALDRAAVEERDDASVLFRADQPAEALFQRDRGGGHRVLRERIAPLGLDLSRPR